MSDTKLTRLERKAKELRPKTMTANAALDRARKDWGELMAWAHTILGDGDGLKERWAVSAAKDETPFFEECDECRDRVQRDAGKQGTLLSAWAWHILDPDHGSAPASPTASAPPSEDHALTERLRQAAALSPPPTSSVPASEPPPVAPPPPKTYPISHDTAYGPVEEFEDHLRVLQTMWDKRSWLRQFGRFPWVE
jgi:hypothetical protein